MRAICRRDYLMLKHLLNFEVSLKIDSKSSPNAFMIAALYIQLEVHENGSTLSEFTPIIEKNKTKPGQAQNYKKVQNVIWRNPDTQFTHPLILALYLQDQIIFKSLLTYLESRLMTTKYELSARRRTQLTDTELFALSNLRPSSTFDSKTGGECAVF